MTQDIFYLAQSSDEEILKRAEHGGVVTTLLKFALESERVDAVLALKPRAGSRYEGVPTLIADPEQVIETAGSMHCTSPNIARCLRDYLDGALNLRVAVVGKPCDIRGIIELAKRKQIEMENLILVGINCTGTLPAATAKRMLRQEFDLDPDDIAREDIEDGRLTLTLRDGTEREEDLAQLEAQGYGRRENCQRCEVNIPTMADIACGKWGTYGARQTWVEICSPKGSDLVQAAIKAGAIHVEAPSDQAVQLRQNKSQTAIDLAKKQQELAFADLRGNGIEERFHYWTRQFDQCIKCFGCRDACPICYCQECTLEVERGLIPGGQVPPDIMFPILRTIHVADSCVNCGQCQDICPSELPLARLVHMLNAQTSPLLGYRPGMDLGAPPPLSTIPEEELEAHGIHYPDLRTA